MMDEKAFLSVNLRDIANGRLDESVVEGLRWSCVKVTSIIS